MSWYQICYLTFSKKLRSSNEELDIECHHGQGVRLCGSNLTIDQIRGVLIQASLFGNLRALPIAVHEVAVEANTSVIELPRCNFQPDRTQWKKGKSERGDLLDASPRPKTIFLGEAAQLPIWSQNGIGENYLRQLRVRGTKKKLNDAKGARLSWVKLSFIEFSRIQSSWFQLN